MIELLFSESAAASLALVKEDGGEFEAAAVVMTGEGASRAPYAPEPYSGARVAGSYRDIISLWLMADIGDISNLPYSHIDLWRTIDEGYAGWEGWMNEQGWAEREALRAHAAMRRVREAGRTGEHVRIWYSDAPGDACGFCWAMNALKTSAGSVTAVKLPLYFPLAEKAPYIHGMESPAQFYALLSLERGIGADERAFYASEWNRLRQENAPLRAMINGRLHSVPEAFYDFALRRVLAAGEQRAVRAIGRALAEGPEGVQHWWYARRLEALMPGVME